MNNSIDILKSIYKPYRYTIKGKSTLIETTTGDYIIKEKNKDIKELYNYLKSRGFTNYPKLIDGSRKDVNVYEYIEDIKIPKEQKFDDLIDTIALLHYKTSYYKEVSEDTYKRIYEDIKSNISYLENYYNLLYDNGFKEVFTSPSNYELMRNYNHIIAALNYASKELDDWYTMIKGETKIRVSIVHNNLEYNHFLENENNYLISWDNYGVDTPIKDIVKLYKKEYRNINFSNCLSKYIEKYPLLEYEKKLLFILLTIPPVINEEKTEFNKCINCSKMLDYVYKTEDLLRPYITEDKKEKQE